MGEVIAGQRLDSYQLTELLARSGMASIFTAVDTRSGQKVALKVPHMQFESDVGFYERFRREEQIGLKLDHPNIVRVLDPGERSRMYLVMEFAEGRSLRAILHERRRLSVDEALGIARQICSALVFMHEQGIVHRDLKPDNVLLTPDGQVKLLDFGIAMDEAARRLTWFGLSPPIGTPDYMAPEQVKGKRGDVRTDIYALGTMLYEMLTGTLPFTGNVHAIMRAKLDDNPRPPHEVLPGIDPKIEEVIVRAIERSPRERYGSAREMLHHLEGSLSGHTQRSLDETRIAIAASEILRAVVGPVLLVVVMAGLLALNWKMGHSAGHRRPTPPANTDSPREERR